MSDDPSIHRFEYEMPNGSVFEMLVLCTKEEAIAHAARLLLEWQGSVAPVSVIKPHAASSASIGLITTSAID